MKQKIFNLIIIDESGSMQSIYQQAISGLNETIQTIRKAQEDFDDQEHYISLVSFNTDKIKTIHDRIPISNITEIDADKYNPNYGTPLFDAMGQSINHLNHCITENDKVLVTIITDGYENASREYNIRSIKELVEAMKEKGWIFTYIGANQDAIKYAEQMSINNSLNFEASVHGTNEMWARESQSRSKLFGFMSRRFRNVDTTDEDNNYNEQSDYFKK